jgi:NAD-dependent SIR2 family protein deacetylase
MRPHRSAYSPAMTTVLPASFAGSAPSREPADRLLADLAALQPLLVLSGAGISAGTGIPTYRDHAGRWLRSDPIQHQDFVRDPARRQRYWGRSLLGWPGVRDAVPAPAHYSLARLEARGRVRHVVTQNVDRLHQRAGSRNVTDLHGRLDRVRCLGCESYSDRQTMQARLEEANRDLREASRRAEVRPDGDADLPDDLVAGVRVPPCERCGGVLMPDVVFFGGSIPKARVMACRRELEQSAALLVIGSSLRVYSGFRFCRWAAELGLPIFLLNPGTTRADDLGRKWTEDADTALLRLEEALS